MKKAGIILLSFLLSFVFLTACAGGNVEMPTDGSPSVGEESGEEQTPSNGDIELPPIDI